MAERHHPDPNSSMVPARRSPQEVERLLHGDRDPPRRVRAARQRGSWPACTRDGRGTRCPSLLSPALLLTGLINWDLLAVALVAGALWAWARGRPVLSGVLIGLGTAAKLYPLFLLGPDPGRRLAAPPAARVRRRGRLPPR